MEFSALYCPIAQLKYKQTFCKYRSRLIQQNANGYQSNAVQLQSECKPVKSIYANVPPYVCHRMSIVYRERKENKISA